MNQKISSNIIALCFGVLVIVFVIGFYAFAAWTEPTAEPPLDNVSAPINVGTDSQIKQGPLQVDGFRNIGTTVLDGNVGIGTTTPGVRLDVDGSFRITAIPTGTVGTYTPGWYALQVCQFGTCCPIMKDCDGDGHTFAMGTDCDEGCPDCFVGQYKGTVEPDGRDQNCDGTVDEFVAHPTERIYNPEVPGVGDGLIVARTTSLNTFCHYCWNMGGYRSGAKIGTGPLATRVWLVGPDCTVAEYGGHGTTHVDWVDCSFTPIYR